LVRQSIWRVLAVLAALAAAAALVATKPARLGLDLRGGTQIVLEAQETAERELDSDTLVRTLEVLRRRVDQLGVSEPNLQRSGDDRIIIELPGVTDPEEALEVIGRTAQLTFHPVEGIARNRPRNDHDDLELPDEGGAFLRLGPAALTGDGVGDAEAILDSQRGGQWYVSVSFRDEGADRWEQATTDAACEPGGIAPAQGGDPRRDGDLQPRGRSQRRVRRGHQWRADLDHRVVTEEEAKDLALLIRAGALPVPVEVVEQRTVGPTLGDAAVRASIEAAVIGGLLTITYVIAY
jgi:SecD/SecF fusion protein